MTVIGLDPVDTESGLCLVGHRYYNPTIGRFLTRDPAKDGLNWFAYLDNNPLSDADPKGYGSYWLVRLFSENGIGRWERTSRALELKQVLEIEKKSRSVIAETREDAKILIDRLLPDGDYVEHAGHEWVTKDGQQVHNVNALPHFQAQKADKLVNKGGKVHIFWYVGAIAVVALEITAEHLTGLPFAFVKDIEFVVELAADYYFDPLAFEVSECRNSNLYSWLRE